ncbi:hypothetical protein Pse7429DRAFT_2234 [Pseudanabaena biceps PCC 7429]|uniref:Uncharacterized protein n=1 Tax=Pseudanabaena biceps PCC 7429 TaxID=927668 RepID=L8MYH2_9CYAN|nr:hypothetical protein Pse7429DRAFT_2234 [Pseudanabaena biceps PCC 7429]
MSNGRENLLLTLIDRQIMLDFQSSLESRINMLRIDSGLFCLPLNYLKYLGNTNQIQSVINTTRFKFYAT